MTERLTLAECSERLAEARRLVPTNRMWRHLTSGGMYFSVGVCLREQDMVVLVKYRPEERPDVEFCRPIGEFRERFERAYR